MRAVRIWIFSALLSSSMPALANTQPLGLGEAIELAVANSPDLEARQARVDAADAAVIPAGQLPDPEMVVGIEDLPVNGDLAYSLTRDSFTARKVGVMQTFPRRRKRELRSQRAANDVQLTAAEQEFSALDVKRQVAQSWIAVSVAEETAQRLRSLEPIFVLQVRMANAGVATTRLTTADALAAQVALVEYRDRLRVAEQEARRSRVELARWLPSDAERPLAAAPNFMELAVGAEQLLGNVHHHASVRAFDAQLDAAHTDIALAKADKRPDWSVELGYAKRGREFSDMVSLEFRIGLPLFASRRQDPVIAEKYARLRQIEAERETELRMHTADVTQQLSNWETLKARFVTYESELLPLTRARADVALSAFKASQSTVKPVLDARTAEIDAELQALELHGQLGRTWAFLSYLQNPKDSR